MTLSEATAAYEQAQRNLQAAQAAVDHAEKQHRIACRKAALETRSAESCDWCGGNKGRMRPVRVSELTA